MDEDGRLKRRKRFDGKMVPRVIELLPEECWSQAIEQTKRGFAWKRNIDSEVRDAVEVEAFRRMNLDEQLRNCLRPEELPEAALSDIWDEVNAHLGTQARSLQELVEELGVRRFGKRPRVGDPFCGGGSIPFEAARIGCDVYASDLNPIACLLTWGALNLVGGTDEARAKIANMQKAVIRAVDEEITRLGIEHNGDLGDLRLLADAPNRWPHGYKVDRAGEVIEPTVPPSRRDPARTGKHGRHRKTEPSSEHTVSSSWFTIREGAEFALASQTAPKLIFTASRSRIRTRNGACLLRQAGSSARTIAPPLGWCLTLTPSALASRSRWGSTMCARGGHLRHRRWRPQFRTRRPAAHHVNGASPRRGTHKKPIP
jgi:hypothetical protein